MNEDEGTASPGVPKAIFIGAATEVAIDGGIPWLGLCGIVADGARIGVFTGLDTFRPCDGATTVDSEEPNVPWSICIDIGAGDCKDAGAVDDGDGKVGALCSAASDRDPP